MFGFSRNTPIIGPLFYGASKNMKVFTPPPAPVRGVGLSTPDPSMLKMAPTSIATNISAPESNEDTLALARAAEAEAAQAYQNLINPPRPARGRRRTGGNTAKGHKAVGTSMTNPRMGG